MSATAAHAEEKRINASSVTAVAIEAIHTPSAAVESDPLEAEFCLTLQLEHRSLQARIDDHPPSLPAPAARGSGPTAPLFNDADFERARAVVGGLVCDAMCGRADPALVTSELVPRLAAAFRLTPAHVPPALALDYAALLLSLPRGALVLPLPSSHATKPGKEPTLARLPAGTPGTAVRRAMFAVRLLLAVRSELLHAQAALDRVVALGATDAALRLVEGMPQLAPDLARAHTEQEQYKHALVIVDAFDLHAAFPDARYLSDRQAMEHLVHKGAVELAAAHCRGPRAADLQRNLVETLLADGEVDLALQYRSRFNLQAAVPLSPATERAHRKRFAQTHLQLPLNLSADIVFVSADDAVAQTLAATWLTPLPEERSPDCRTPSIVGLDAEWKPTMHAPGSGDDHRGQQPVALLQVAYRRKVVLLDMLSLPPEVCDMLLQPLFSAAGVVKTGFAFAGDIALLRASRPNVRAFDNLGPFAELQDVTRAARLRVGRGLAALCQAQLGKTLSKVDRMTDWSQRPLTERQVRYAALDALCCVHLLAVLGGKMAGSEGMASSFGLDNDGVLGLSRSAWSVLRPLSKGLVLERGRPVSHPAVVSPLGGAAHAAPSAATRAHDEDLRHAGLEADGPAAAKGAEGNMPAPPADDADVMAVAAQQQLRMLEPITASQDDDALQPLGEMAVRTALEAARTSAEGAPSDMARLLPASEAERLLRIQAVPAKTIALIAAERPVAALLREADRIDLKRLRAYLSLQKTELRLATPSECVQVFGYVPGKHQATTRISNLVLHLTRFVVVVIVVFVSARSLLATTFTNSSAFLLSLIPATSRHDAASWLPSQRALYC
jgi:hypothetical protein